MKTTRSARQFDAGNRRNGPLDFETLTLLCAGKKRRSGLESEPHFCVPCPQCRPHRKRVNQQRPVLAIWCSAGFAGYSCAHCGIKGWACEAGRAIDRRELERERIENVAKQSKDAERVRQWVLAIWREALPIVGTLAERYLIWRGISGLPPLVNGVLRFHPHCPFGKDEHGVQQYFPCLVALLRDVLTDEPCGIHRTALTSDGRNIECEPRRRCLGRKKGAAIKLWSDAEVSQGLVVGEGLETMLWAATHIVDDGALLQPAWALIDAGNLEIFPVLSGIEALTILVDHDEPSKEHPGGRGQEAAEICATRWRAAEREAIKFMPRKLGDDFNDLRRLSAA